MTNPEFLTKGMLIKCVKCKRPILVEQAINGSDHAILTIATCWDCLDDDGKKKAKELYSIKEKG